MTTQTIQIEDSGRSFSAFSEGEGPLVLCFHGFPDHARSFRHQLPALAQSGRRGVAPMLRGYEASSQLGRVVADYHPLQIAGDMIAWARTLGAGSAVDLVGHDWGALAGFLACQLEPSLFRSYTAIAVPNSQAFEDGLRRHPGQLRKSWYMLFFQLRGLADAVVRRGDLAFIEKLWRDWSPGWDWEPEEMESLKATFREPDVLWYALAYYRATLNPFLQVSKRASGMTRQPIAVPTLAVTGAGDGCIDTRIFDCIDPGLFPKGVRVERIEDAGHFVHQERPETFNSLLLGWLEDPTLA